VLTLDIDDLRLEYTDPNLLIFDFMGSLPDSYELRAKSNCSMVTMSSTTGLSYVKACDSTGQYSVTVGKLVLRALALVDAIAEYLHGRSSKPEEAVSISDTHGILVRTA
jgi:hypothetical protein